jgi:hypothetical protein
MGSVASQIRSPTQTTRRQQLGYFENPQEVYKYIGGIFRVAESHPEVAPKLKAAKVGLRLHLLDPDAQLTVKFHDPIEVIDGPTDATVDVHMYAHADIADRFFRGDYNLAVGVAKGEVKAIGPVKKILKLVPIAKPLFPIYRELTADKGRGGAPV